jgi:hypothetical protein
VAAVGIARRRGVWICREATGGEGRGRVRVGHHLVLHHGRKARRRARVDGSAVGRISFDATGAEASGGRGERVWRAEAVA